MEESKIKTTKLKPMEKCENILKEKIKNMIDQEILHHSLLFQVLFIYYFFFYFIIEFEF